MLTETMLRALSIFELQDALTLQWHTDPAVQASDGASLEELIARQHLANVELWHAEDAARDPSATDATLAQTKRQIDAINQVRNDLVERMDQILLDSLAEENLPAVDAPLHSETPGLMIDRLSILSLKIFHTKEELERAEVEAEHLVRNRKRLGLLLEQRSDLASCLDVLWQQILAGERRFKMYRQLKMYNDPDLNPVLYKAGKPRTA